MVGFDSYVPLVNGGGVGGWLWPVGHSPPTPPPPGAPGVRGGGVGLGGGVAGDVADAAP